jgi:hypothetical protein
MKPIIISKINIQDLKNIGCIGKSKDNLINFGIKNNILIKNQKFCPFAKKSITTITIIKNK